MTEIDAEFDLAGLDRWIDAKVKKQLPFAMALSLTRTAQDAQTRTRGDLAARFTIRRPFVAKGIRIKSARKSARLGDIKAQVGTVDAFMALQDAGGTKTGRGGGRVAVPVGARPRQTSVTPRSKWPGALLKKPGYFLAPLAGEDGALGVWKRAGGKRRRGKARGGQRRKLQYVLTDSVDVPARWQFEDTVSAVVASRHAGNFNAALARALGET